MAQENLTCHLCGKTLESTFADLGVQPLCESYLSVDQLNKMEPSYPLHVYFCKNCFLVQLEESITPQEIYNKYAYFSSSSKGWLKHCESYADMIIEKMGLNNDSQVIEVASNDGYMLKFFAQQNIPVLGVEAASNVADEALKKGLPTIKAFFNKKVAEDLVKNGRKADLLIANNIISQVPDIHDFVEGLKTLLKPSGLITLEFHYLKNLVEKNQFDTISHERFFYFSFFVIEQLLSSHDLTIFDVEEVPTHGGSLRVYACHSENGQITKAARLNEIKAAEKISGFMEYDTYISFSEKVRATKRDILDILIRIKRKGKSVVGYGAHAEAHTFLNYCGIRTDFLDYLVDRNPDKQGKYLAGVRLPIYAADKIESTKPDYILILPWSIKREIMAQMPYVNSWGARFIAAIPKLEVYDSQGKELANTMIQEEFL
jgi:hypothetical protein